MNYSIGWLAVKLYPNPRKCIQSPRMCCRCWLKGIFEVEIWILFFSLNFFRFDVLMKSLLAWPIEVMTSTWLIIRKGFRELLESSRLSLQKKNLTSEAGRLLSVHTFYLLHLCACCGCHTHPCNSDRHARCRASRCLQCSLTYFWGK